VRTGHVACATGPVFALFDPGAGEEEGRGWGRAEGEVETAVGADGDEGGDGGAGVVLGGAGVEFLRRGGFGVSSGSGTGTGRETETEPEDRGVDM